MIRGNSFTDALAVAACGFPQPLVQLRRVDQSVIEDILILHRKHDLIVNLVDDLRRDLPDRHGLPIPAL